MSYEFVDYELNYQNGFMSDEMGFGEIDYPDEPELDYETENLMEVLDVEIDTEHYDNDPELIKEAVVIHASQRLEEFILDGSIFKVEEVLNRSGLNYLDDFKQTELLQLACLFCCPSMVEVLCRHNINGYNWMLGTDIEINLDFDKTYDNLQVILIMNYFERFGEFLVDVLWFSDNLPRFGRRRIVNFLNENGLIGLIRENYLKREIKEQFDRQFIPTLNKIVPFGVDKIISSYLC